MKKKLTIKKLALNKSTVTNLDGMEMKVAKGGLTYTCVAPCSIDVWCGLPGSQVKICQPTAACGGGVTETCYNSLSQCTGD